MHAVNGKFEVLWHSERCCHFRFNQVHVSCVLLPVALSLLHVHFMRNSYHYYTCELEPPVKMVAGMSYHGSAERVRETLVD